MTIFSIIIDQTMPSLAAHLPPLFDVIATVSKCSE